MLRPIQLVVHSKSAPLNFEAKVEAERLLCHLLDAFFEKNHTILQICVDYDVLVSDYGDQISAFLSACMSCKRRHLSMEQFQHIPSFLEIYTYDATHEQLRKYSDGNFTTFDVGYKENVSRYEHHQLFEASVQDEPFHDEYEVEETTLLIHPHSIGKLAEAWEIAVAGEPRPRREPNAAARETIVGETILMSMKLFTNKPESKHCTVKLANVKTPRDVKLDDRVVQSFTAMLEDGSFRLTDHEVATFEHEKVTYFAIGAEMAEAIKQCRGNLTSMSTTTSSVHYVFPRDCKFKASQKCCYVQLLHDKRDLSFKQRYESTMLATCRSILKIVSGNEFDSIYKLSRRKIRSIFKDFGVTQNVHRFVDLVYAASMPSIVYKSLRAYILAVENGHKRLRFKSYTVYNKSFASAVRTALIDERVTKAEVAESIDALVDKDLIRGPELEELRVSWVRDSMRRKRRKVPDALSNHRGATHSAATTQQQQQQDNEGTQSAQQSEIGTTNDSIVNNVPRSEDDTIFGNLSQRSSNSLTYGQIAKSIVKQVKGNISAAKANAARTRDATVDAQESSTSDPIVDTRNASRENTNALIQESSEDEQEDEHGGVELARSNNDAVEGDESPVMRRPKKTLLRIAQIEQQDSEAEQADEEIVFDGVRNGNMNTQDIRFVASAVVMKNEECEETENAATGTPIGNTTLDVTMQDTGGADNGKKMLIVNQATRDIIKLVTREPSENVIVFFDASLADIARTQDIMKKANKRCAIMAFCTDGDFEIEIAVVINSPIVTDVHNSMHCYLNKELLLDDVSEQSGNPAPELFALPGSSSTSTANSMLEMEGATASGSG